MGVLQKTRTGQALKLYNTPITTLNTPQHLLHNK